MVITDDANTLSPGHTKIDRQAALITVNQFVFCHLLYDDDGGPLP